MNEAIQVAITAHRNIEDDQIVRQPLEKIYHAYNKNIELIVGGAVGGDTLAALWAVDFNVPFHMHFPFPYNNTKNIRLKRLAESVKVLYDNYKGAWQYQKRNESMVDDCDILVAFWTGKKEKCGTYNCMKYARKVLIPIIEIKVKEGEDSN